MYWEGLNERMECMWKNINERKVCERYANSSIYMHVCEGVNERMEYMWRNINGSGRIYEWVSEGINERRKIQWYIIGRKIIKQRSEKCIWKEDKLTYYIRWEKENKIRFPHYKELKEVSFFDLKGWMIRIYPIRWEFWLCENMFQCFWSCWKALRCRGRSGWVLIGAFSSVFKMWISF